MRCYRELIQIPDFRGRFRYLKLDGDVGKSTFGSKRYLNQKFYESNEWKSVRNFVITRDLGCNMALKDHEIQGTIYIHHINPIDEHDIIDKTSKLLNPDNLVCVSSTVHKAVHYGSEEMLFADDPIERRPGDTCPWK